MKKIYIMDSNTGIVYKDNDKLPENIKPILMECYEWLNG